MTENIRLKWFRQARYGMFLHFGPYAAYGRGEQVLFREHMDQRDYAEKACRWNPEHYDPKVWADVARRSGMKYAVLTTRHHDGYCLWDSRHTDYTSAKQAPKRDFVREYVEAFRAAGLRVGLYYSLLDWRIPAYFAGPEHDPDGWRVMRRYIHDQVEELLTNYGPIDIIWFDGVWPRTAEDLGSAELVEKIRELQPGIIINNRLGRAESAQLQADGGEGAGGTQEFGDFGTPEQHIVPESGRVWEACMVTGWRLWGYTRGERWRPADLLLGMLCDCAEQGGNLLMNVGPQPDGLLPPEFVERAQSIGSWLEVHGEAIFGADGGNVTEFVTRGTQTVSGNNLYLIIRFWDGEPVLRLADLTTPVKRVELLTTGQELSFTQNDQAVIIQGLPREAPSRLFPVIKLECDGKPEGGPWARERLWSGDPLRCLSWAQARGTSVWTDGTVRSPV